MGSGSIQEIKIVYVLYKYYIPLTVFTFWVENRDPRFVSRTHLHICRNLLFQKRNKRASCVPHEWEILRQDQRDWFRG